MLLALFRSPIPTPPPATARPRRRLVVASGAAGEAAAYPAATMYDILSVATTAGPEEIKAAYRRQARRWHPDACRTAGEEGLFAERFKRTREAYEVLSDPALRRDYDLQLLQADGWAAVVARGVVLRCGRERQGWNWEVQLEELEKGRRRGGGGWRRRSDGGEESWGSRVRRAHGLEPSNWCDPGSYVG